MYEIKEERKADRHPVQVHQTNSPDVGLLLPCKVINEFSRTTYPNITIRNRNAFWEKSTEAKTKEIHILSNERKKLADRNYVW